MPSRAAECATCCWALHASCVPTECAADGVPCSHYVLTMFSLCYSIRRSALPTHCEVCTIIHTAHPHVHPMQRPSSAYLPHYFRTHTADADMKTKRNLSFWRRSASVIDMYARVWIPAFYFELLAVLFNIRLEDPYYMNSSSKMYNGWGAPDAAARRIPLDAD